jgi:hypothetical protein
MDFPHYKILFNPFSVHDSEDINVDATIGYMHRNKLNINKIFEIARKFLYDSTKHNNHIICYKIMIIVFKCLSYIRC